jgi:acyl-coenzyme A synthetase/AMP-(fatty) acid ligase
VVRAYVVLASGKARVPDAELSQWVAGRLESHKVPNRFVWVTELPRTSSGKLVRRTLREQAKSEQ